jgi:glutaredoxin
MMQERRFSEPAISVTDVGGQSKVRQIRVTVFTSKGCIFCKEAITMLREAAGRFSHEQLGVEVIESRVDEKPELVESLDIVAVPTILVGRTRLIGLPRLEELESLLHEAMFFPTGL